MEVELIYELIKQYERGKITNGCGKSSYTLSKESVNLAANIENIGHCLEKCCK